MSVGVKLFLLSHSDGLGDNFEFVERAMDVFLLDKKVEYVHTVPAPGKPSTTLLFLFYSKDKKGR